jgi:hypothetical protein
MQREAATTWLIHSGHIIMCSADVICHIARASSSKVIIVLLRLLLDVAGMLCILSSPLRWPVCHIVLLPLLLLLLLLLPLLLRVDLQATQLCLLLLCLQPMLSSNTQRTLLLLLLVVMGLVQLRSPLLLLTLLLLQLCRLL